MHNKDVAHDNPLMGGDDDSGGSKIALNGDAGLWARLQKRGYNTDTIWKQICLLLVKSLVVVDDKMSFQPNAFEVIDALRTAEAPAPPHILSNRRIPPLSYTHRCSAMMC